MTDTAFSLNVESIIFIAFLVINLVAGLIYSKGVKTIDDYALGGRNFNTGTLAYTIVATYISGGVFSVYLSEIYTNGLLAILKFAGEFLAFFLIAYIFIPRMQRFLGDISIAQTMGNLYGERVGYITSICGVICALGYVTIQFKLAGLIFNYVFGIKEFWGVIIAGLIITCYSSFGGIKSVTFTDVVQLYTFGVVIHLAVYQIFTTIGDYNIIIDTVKNSPNFDLSIFKTPKGIKYIFLFLFAAIPAFNPSFFQRFVMAKSVEQAQKSFFISAFIILLMGVLITWISIILLSKNPNLEFNGVLKYFIFDTMQSQFFKACIFVGIMAMIMSTADSYINSSSVLIVTDLMKKAKINKLLVARIVALLLGFFCIFLAMYKGTFLEIIIFAFSFYMPIVTVPFLMAIFGYQTPYEKAVLGGMFAGFVTVLAWHFFDIKVVDNIIPAMAANALTLIFIHKYHLFRGVRAVSLDNQGNTGEFK